MKPQETPVNYPPYWITSNEDVKAYLEKNAVKGKVSVAGYSAGGREILVYEYGEKEVTKQTVTLSSAWTARKPELYTQRPQRKKQTIVLKRRQLRLATLSMNTL